MYQSVLYYNRQQQNREKHERVKAYTRKTVFSHANTHICTRSVFHSPSLAFPSSDLSPVFACSRMKTRGPGTTVSFM